MKDLKKSLIRKHAQFLHCWCEGFRVHKKQRDYISLQVNKDQFSKNTSKFHRPGFLKCINFILFPTTTKCLY